MSNSTGIKVAMDDSERTKVKARMFDLNSKILELVREKNIDPNWIALVFQMIVEKRLQPIIRYANYKGTEPGILIPDPKVMGVKFLQEEFHSYDFFNKETTFDLNRLIIEYGFSKEILDYWIGPVSEFKGTYSRYIVSCGAHMGVTDMGVIDDLSFSAKIGYKFLDFEETLSAVKFLIDQHRKTDNLLVKGKGSRNFIFSDLGNGRIITVNIAYEEPDIWKIDADPFGTYPIIPNGSTVFMFN